MIKFNQYSIHIYQIKIGDNVGWAYQLYEGPSDELTILTDEFPKEVFDSPTLAEFAAIGHISLLDSKK